MAITKEQVFETATQMEAAGEKVTTRSVVAKIGGSNTKINDFLKVWKEEKAHNESLDSVEIDEALLEKHRLFVAEVCRAANKNAQVDNAALREQNLRLKDEIETLEAEHAAHLDEVQAKHAEQLEAAAAERNQINEELEVEKTNNELADKALKEAETQIQRLQTEVARLQGQAEERAKSTDLGAIKDLLESLVKDKN